jgi:hypothetical protein
MGEGEYSMRYATLAVLLVVGACSSSVDGGNSAGGIVSGNSDAKSFQAANAWCGKYDKIARISSERARESGSSIRAMSFDCVKPE